MTYSSEVLADSPLAYYRFAEASGTTLVDSSGNGRNGAYSTTPAHAASLVMDSGDSSFSLPATTWATVTDASWMYQSSLTLEAWIKPTSFADNPIIVNRDNENVGRRFQLRLNTTNSSLELIFWTATGGPFFCTATTTMTVNTVYHVAATYDGANARLYLNGSLIKTVAQSGGMSLGGGVDLVIARHIYNNGISAAGALNGVIDEVAYYGTALSQTRLAAHYTAATTSASVGSISATVSGPTAALTGTAAPTATGTLVGTVSGPTAALSGTTTPPTSGSLTGTLSGPTAALSGSAAAPTPPVTGTLAGSLASLAGSLTGAVADPTPPDPEWPGEEIVLDDEATFVDDEPRTGSRTAWWFWQAPEDPVAVEFTLLDADPDDPEATSQALLSIYAGSTLATPGAILVAPASGTTYYIKASLPSAAPDEDFQLAVAPPADDESYVMDLEVLSGPLRAAPTAVVVSVDGGLSLDDVEFRVDGVLTGDESTLDESGSLDATSINVADGYDKGEHIVSVHSKTSDLAGEGTFVLQRGPYLSLQTVGLDAKPIEIPAANTPTGVRRWVLQDLMPGGLGSWVMPRNPSSMSAPEFQRTLTQVHTTSVDDGRFHLASVAHEAVDWTFTGYVDSQLEQQKLEAYYQLNRRFYVIDHRSRAWIVAFHGLEVVPRKRQPKDDGSFNDWAADYTVTALIYDQDWRSPT